MRTQLCFLSTVLFATSTALAQAPSTPRPARQLSLQVVPLQIEYSPSKKPETDTLSLRIREESTGAQAVATLNAQSQTGTYQGVFVVQFALGDRSDKTLQFLDPEGRELFTWQKPKGRILIVKLVETDEERQRLVEAEAPAVAPKKPAPKGKKQPSPEEIAKQVAQAEAEARLKAQQAEQARLDLERREALRRAELLQKQAELSAAQKKKRQEDAQVMAKQAMAAYRAGDFKKSVGLFQKAAELDPEDDRIYHQYGIALYKIDRYNSSLAMLSMAEGDVENKVERSYYIALNQMKLKEYDKALKEFRDIRDENEPELSPVASFFAGTIEYQTQKYPEARKSFEYVLDNSKDPQLDTQAEQMIEQIDRVENFLALSKERFRVNLTAGLINDSNMLNVSQENLQTKASAWRANYGASVLTNLYRNYPSEIGLQLSVNDYYSVDSGFKSDATLQLADALEMAASLPMKTQFEAAQRAYFLELTPAVKTLSMAPNGGSREVIDNVTVVNASMTTGLSPLWMLALNAEWGQDKFKLTPSSADDEQSGTHTTLGFSLTRLLDLRGSKSITGDASMTDNVTEGINNRSKKNVLGVTYAFPVPKEFLGSLRVDYTSQAYGEATTPRTDKITTATLGASKALSKAWNMALSAVYSTSASDVDLYKYDKTMVSAVFTYTLSVSRK